MSTGKVGVDKTVAYGLRTFSAGGAIPAVAVAAIDQTILVRNSNNAATVVAAAVEDGTGDYHFVIPNAYSTTNGAGVYFGNITVSSTSPRVADVIPFELDFFVNDMDDDVQVGGINANAITGAAIATDAIDADAIAADAIGTSELATSAVEEIRDAILSDSTAFDGADIAAILLDTGTTLPAQIAALNDLGLTDLISFAPTLGSLEESLLHAMYDTPIGVAVTIDPQAANTSTTIGNGTMTNPVSTEVAARTIADAMAVRKYFVTNFGTVTLTQTTFDWHIAAGYNLPTLDMNGQDAAGILCEGMQVTGLHANSFAFANQWRDCLFKDASGIDGILRNCLIDPAFALGLVGGTLGATLINCSSSDDSVVDLDCGGANQLFLRIFNWNGLLALSNMNNVLSDAQVECAAGAQVRLDADVLQGNIRIGGTENINNLGSVVPDTSGRVGEVADDYLGQLSVHGSGLWDATSSLTVPAIVAGVWGELLPGAFAPGTAGRLVGDGGAGPWTTGSTDPTSVARITDMWRRLNLDPANDVVHTDATDASPGSIVVGSGPALISITLTKVGPIVTTNRTI